MINIEELERQAKAAQANSDNIGEQDWYEADEIASLMHGLIAKADARLMAGCTPLVILTLIAEIRTLREDLQAAKLLAHANGEMFEAEKVDAERYRWAVSLEDNAETLYGAVMSCGPSARQSIDIEVDAARGIGQSTTS